MARDAGTRRGHETGDETGDEGCHSQLLHLRVVHQVGSLGEKRASGGCRRGVADSSLWAPSTLRTATGPGPCFRTLGTSSLPGAARICPVDGSVLLATERVRRARPAPAPQ